ncbi:MAG: efflux RND transporter periplasmic adaptor subunit [Candidatus Moranbacteria bacterium]|nr:efflux RND transporter periplasmic adaptor subunit [Candidatus Moranbacteria bacterium]MDD3964546.1 efflux RND transporter periplasmic adaptor subunit [Candidatus Moranbacteria bacterium]
MKKKYTIGLVILVALGGYFWYNSTQSKTGTVKYVTTQAEKGTITTAISGSGNIVVDQLATVDPTITGTVANVAVNVGDTVKKDQLLFTIINEDLVTSKLQSLVSLQNAQISVSQAKANLSNARDGGTDTERDRNILKEKIKIAEQSLLVAELNYRNAVSDSAKRQVTSPINGTVNAINIKNGDDLSRLSKSSTSQAPMIIGDLETLKAEVEVNEVDIANVSLGQKVTMTYSALDGLTIPGKVEKMDALGTITQGIVNYKIIIGLDMTDERLRPSMSVSAKIITNVKQDVIIVPNSALKMRGNKTYVEVLNSKTGLPEQRMIEIGIANNTQTEIVKGISVGDAVVTQTVDPNAKTTTPTTGSGIRIPGMGGRG